MDVKTKLDTAWSNYLQEISALGRQIYRDQVKLFCEKYDYNFSSSLVTGEWQITSRGGDCVMGHYKCKLNEEEALNLYDILRLRVSGISGDLATLIPNFEIEDNILL